MKSRITVAVGLLGVLALSACSGSPTSGDTSSSGETSSNQSAQLLIQVGPTAGAAYEAMASAFEAAHPGVEIAIAPAEINAQTNALLQTQLASQSGPDIVMVGAGSGGFPPSGYSFATQGFLSPLDGSPWLSTIPENVQPLLAADGKTYLYPNGMMVVALGYYPESFEQWGITAPETLDDLLDLCRDIRGTHPDVAPIAFPAGNLGSAAFVAGTIAAGQVYADNPDWNEQKADGKVSFADSEQWRTTLGEIVQMRDADCFAPSAASDGNNEAATQLANGTAAMILAPTGAIVTAETVKPGVEPTIAALPAIKANDTRLAPFPARVVGVNSSSPFIDVAKSFIDFMATPEMQKTYVDAAAGAEVPAGDFYSGNLPQFWKPIATMVPDSVPMPIITWPTPTTLLEVLAPGIQGLLTGTSSVDDVLQGLDASWGT